MPVLTPTSLDGVLHALAEHPGAAVLAGGTDLMVEVNAGHSRPETVIALRNVRELRERRRVGPTLSLGAAVTYRELLAADVATAHPALAAAARTVGSPQIRNAGTIGGNVATASPAGDTLPVLAALDAVIVLRSLAGERRLRCSEYFTGPKRTARRPDELVVAVELPVFESRQDYLKVGTRNAMVISVAGLALVINLERRTLGCALGSVGPVPLRAPEAEAFLADAIDWSTVTAPPAAWEHFAGLVAAAARPIDDHRSTAEYRRHAVNVLAARAARRLLTNNEAA